MATRSRTRLSPAARRAEILETAGRLFAERGYAAVSASEVARQAGVTPGLLHHYFGGKRGLLATLVERLGEQITDVIRVDTTEPTRVRTRAFATAWVDWVDANRQIWLATSGLDDNLADPELRAIIDAIRERVIDGFIADYPATLSDEPQTRLMLRSFLAFNRVVMRGWLDGAVSRAEAERLLADTLHALITDRRTPGSPAHQTPCRQRPQIFTGRSRPTRRRYHIGVRRSDKLGHGAARVAPATPTCAITKADLDQPRPTARLSPEARIGCLLPISKRRARGEQPDPSSRWPLSGGSGYPGSAGFGARSAAAAATRHVGPRWLVSAGSGHRRHDRAIACATRPRWSAPSQWRLMVRGELCCARVRWRVNGWGSGCLGAT